LSLYPKHSTRGTLRPNPENLGDCDAVKDSVFTMLRDDLYWHERIKRVLAAAGFITRRIEQLDTHPVWTMHLVRTSFDLASDNPTVAKQIRKMLCKDGIKILRNELSIVSRKGLDSVRVCFAIGRCRCLEMKP
jgi:hypothetical protein